MVILAIAGLIMLIIGGPFFTYLHYQDQKEERAIKADLELQDRLHGER